jgi:uncharacterized membrane protein YecN with MAPEG domain
MNGGGIMENITIVALYAGLNALLLIILSMVVGKHRMAQKQIEPGSIGEGALPRAIRAHGNFIENAPAAMVMLLVLALVGMSATFLHAFGAVFTVARAAHGYGMMQEKHPNPFRAAGTMGTMLVLLTGAVACIFAYF